MAHLAAREAAPSVHPIPPSPQAFQAPLGAAMAPGGAYDHLRKKDPPCYRSLYLKWCC